VGVWIGACAGIATALGDFGAHWLFMDSARDRIWLLVRLLSLQPAIGAGIGALAGCIAVWSAGPIDRLTRREATRAALRAGLFSALLTPVLWTIAHLLFTGGKMSRVAHAPLWSVLTALCLTLGCACALFVAQRGFAWARTTSRGAAQRTLALLVALGFAIGKLDQWVLPNLYDYLHAVLSAATWAVFALAVALIGTRLWDAGRLRAAWLGSGLIVALLLFAGARLSLATLDQNQNVRVALGSADMPHSRTLLFAVAPWLRRVDAASADLAKRRASGARERRQQLQQPNDLPVLDDAHVLMITVDALRADHLGLHGYGRGVTRELDALGARGVVFDNAYAQAPHSSYSLCSLMTSEYLHETLELGHAPPQATLPRLLTAAGYHTAAFYTLGIFHTAGEQLALYEEDAFGFALHDHQDRPAEQMTDRVLTEIDRTVARGEPSSLFWVHYFDVHEPYEATTLGTSDMDRYDSELLATDRAIGRLVRSAEQRLKKPVVIVVTADHGEEFHEHGGVYHGSSLYQEQVHVPLIFVAPGVAAARRAAPVESIDITPTLLALLGVERAPTMRGIDLRPAFLGRASERPVFSAVIHKKMAVSWPYKLIADLRFGSFELYDLVRDPGERDNQADREPRRLRSLRGEIYAWLDSLAPTSGDSNRHDLALEWGRLGDRRAVAPLASLLLDEQAASGTRSEAARLLGKLADEAASESLFAATHASDAWVAAEAAIALGRMFDPRAASMLRRLVVSEDPGVRSRAGVSLGRLRDPAAVPSLIDALWLAPNPYEREEAVRWLGRLRDARALDPLMNLLPETRTRHLVVVALGELGDPRAFAPLSHVLVWDRNTNVRDGVVRGLAMLGDPRALDVVLPLVSEDPALRNTAEALVRLHALDRKRIGGVDLDAASSGSTSGFAHCFSGPLRHDWDFLHRTYCTTERERAALRLNVPNSVAEACLGSVVLLSAKRADASASVALELSIGQQVLMPVQVDGAWAEYRWELPPGALHKGSLRAEIHVLNPAARVQVDHLLLIPRTSIEAPIAHGG
jgi:arylsulfatase A-like enzyme/HEAT repeat protein